MKSPITICHLFFIFILIILTLECSSFRKPDEEVPEGGEFPCRHRDYGNGATVCVCNEDYCDNLEHVTLDSLGTNGSIIAFVTSKQGDRFTKETLEQQDHKNEKPQLVIKIDPTKRYQKIVGFGGSFSDTAGINIDKLEPKLQERLIRDYYGLDGIEYNMGRVPIGGSDFSMRPYSYDDNAGFEDLELNRFELQYEDLQFKIPYLKMAAKVSPHSVKYLASPWSPPAWMKTNRKLINGGTLIGQPGEEYYKSYAQYLIRFLREYNRNNVTVWGLTIENEPISGNLSIFPWNSLSFDAEMARDFLKLDLGPALKQAGYSDLNVMIFDDSLQDFEEYVSTVLSDQEASRYTTGIAFHWYRNSNYSNREPLEAVNRKFPKYFILSTEACKMLIEMELRDARLDLPQAKQMPLGDWKTVDYYADDIIKDLNHWTGGWIDWNLVVDMQGGPNWKSNYVQAPIVVNGRGTEYFKQPFFYALGHFSKFLSIDSIRLGQNLDFGSSIVNHSSIQATTFLRPDNRTVLTVLNTNEKLVPILVQDSMINFHYILKPNSISSFIWN